MNNNSTHSILFELEEQVTELQLKIKHLDSLLYFLHEFFAYQELDPDSPNEPIRTQSYCLLQHYHDYQNIFEIAFNTAYTINSSADVLSETISAAFEGVMESKAVI